MRDERTVSDLSQTMRDRLDVALIGLCSTTTEAERREVWGTLAELFFWRAMFDYRRELIQEGNYQLAEVINSHIE